jgi:hypothetical protein
MHRLFLVICLLVIPFSWGWTAEYIATSCSASDVNKAISLAAEGDTVIIPAGGISTQCVWGSNTAIVNINKQITLKGSGTSSTIITVGSGAAVYISSSNCKIQDFKMVTDADTASNASFIAVSGKAEQWVISGMVLDQTVKKLGYVIDLTSPRASGADTYGVISGNIIMFDGEQVNYRGPCNSWTTPHSMGGPQNLFVEGNTFIRRPGGSVGYWDSNANARTVWRFNTMQGVYFDAHGSWSNYDVCSPDTHASARHSEVYNNLWDGDMGWTSVYIRGGTGLIFNNKVTNATYGRIFLDEYYVRSGKLSSPNWPYYPNACACKPDYPVWFQVGRGLNQASEPLFIWNNTKDGTELPISNNPYGGPSINCKTYCNDQTLSVSDFIQFGRDVHLRPPQSGDYLFPYSPYTCPHPLTGLKGSCNFSTAGIEGYNVGTLAPPKNLRGN